MVRTDVKKRHTLIGPLIIHLVQHVLETLCRNEGVQALSIPMGSKFEVSADIRHMWGIVPQVKGREEGLDGHRIHLGLVA
jgi:hypothetical protein